MIRGAIGTVPRSTQEVHLRTLRLVGLSLAFLVAVIPSPAAGQWRVDISGGAFVAPSRVDVRQPRGPLSPVSISESAKFDSAGSYALGIGYAVTDHIDL